jgi:hypothetical protein
MPKKNITLSVDLNIYENYVKFCKKRGLVVSRQFELMMENHMKKQGADKNE